MQKEFETDPYPGRPRILFVGFCESSHTESWIRLLDGADLNVRLFCLPSAVPPLNWNIKSYLTSAGPHPDNAMRTTVYPPSKRSLVGLLYLSQTAVDLSNMPGPRIFRV